MKKFRTPDFADVDSLLEETRNRLFDQQRTLMALMRSEIFSGDLLQAVQLLTRTSAQQLDVERASVWRMTADRNAIECIDMFRLSDEKHFSGMTLCLADYPQYVEGLSMEEAIVADFAQNHPNTREFTDGYLKPNGITLMLDVPLHLYGRLEGVLCLEHTGTPISWSPQTRLFAIAIANLAALALEQSERKRADAVIRGQRDVLKMIATGAPIQQTLDALLVSLEAQDPEISCSILLLDADGLHLRHAVAPRLPETFCRAVDGLRIGATAGSCGTAAYLGETVIVTDIANDPVCIDVRNIALSYGFAACWSTPIFDSQQHILGTIAMYYRTPRRPAEHHIRLVKMAAHTAAIAIERTRTVQRIHDLAFFDPLTRLPNRTLLLDRLSQCLTLAERDKKPVALLFVDLDRFKTINDSLGHDIGDQLLKTVAKRMQKGLREMDTISRLGGDEFIILLPETDAAGAEHVAQKVLQVSAEPHNVGTYQLNITPSIGISLYPEDGDNAETLIKNADTAMYDAKAHGRNGYKFFTRSMNVAVVERLHLEHGLREALSKEQFLLEYQPQIDIRSGRIIGAEALLRWRHPELGVIGPGRFIPIAEDAGLIVPIGRWVLFEACRQNHEWQTQGLAKIPIAVNISSQQFRSRLAYTIFEILEQTRLDAQYLELELTEGMVMHSTELTLSTLRSLRTSGVQISIDDFGTGYSSLSYLKRFPINKLKIDRSFTRDIIIDPDDRAIATAIISMSHDLRLRVIAEGVETAAQLQVLREQDCDEAQGYFFSRPLTAGEFAETLRSGLGHG